MDRSKITGAFVDRALQFIQQAQNEGKPFYVNLWPDDVHSPFFPPKASAGRRQQEGALPRRRQSHGRAVRAAFSITSASHPACAPTPLYLASDNGPEPGAGSAGPFRGTKEPLRRRHPGALHRVGARVYEQSRRGTVNKKTVVSALDLLPSVARLGGGPLSGRKDSMART